MSLRTALAALPDDRATMHAVREIVALFADHPGEPLRAVRIERVTGFEPARVEPVLRALAEGVVIDCDGDPSLGACTYHRDTVLQLEVERYLRSAGSQDVRKQSSLGKFRSRLGRD